MKKLVLVLGLMLVMGLSLVGCGSTESKNEVVNGGGFTPNKPSTETVVETETEEVVSLEMTVEEMKEYYNDNEFVGTPRIEVVKVLYDEFRKLWLIHVDTMNADVPIENLGLERDVHYNCIITDNGTPDNYRDDTIAYIFTTPIE
jgi:hypothetical protein